MSLLVADKNLTAKRNGVSKAPTSKNYFNCLDVRDKIVIQ